MQEASTTDILSITTTVADREGAQTLAHEILARRLAACVQIEQGLHSIYRWQGELCEGAEVRLVIKTMPHCRQALQELFAEHHPYDVPQFLAVRMQASAAYFGWADSQVRTSGASG